MNWNVLSLFSGIGGLDLGLERAGMTTIGQVELDPFCRGVLARHWPEVPQHDDVRTAIDWWRSEERPGVDVIAGGFPCQGHSVAGRQLGPGDPRWGWPWYRDVLDALAPPIIIVENVGNLVRTGLLDVLEDLAARGFDVEWGRVPAAALGAPHLRWRLFLIAAHPDRLHRRTGRTWRPVHARQAGKTQPDAGLARGWDDAVWFVYGRRSADRPDVADPRGAAGRRTWSALAGAGGQTAGDPFEPRRCGVGLDERTWPPEPDVGRVAHGVPERLDRLRTLGNAVVPAVGEYIGRLVMDGARAYGK